MNPSTPLSVGKSHLDAHILDSGHERRFDNTKVGRRALHNWLLKHGVARVVFEPTGRFHRNLHQCLGDAGLQTVLVNPLRSRHFAEAIGVLAKNDRVDDAMLTRFGRLDSLESSPPPSRNLVLLSDLLALRRKLRDELNPEAGPTRPSTACATRSPTATAACAHASPPTPAATAARGTCAAAARPARCSSWPPPPRSVAIPLAAPTTRASSLAASPTRLRSSPSCAA